MTETVELLPCPFCGETPTVFNTDHHMGGKWGFVSCCCDGPQVRTGYQSEEHWRAEAIAAWNIRTPPTIRRGRGGGGGDYP
jgi:Lar family restriction alleviation protein